RSEDPCHGTTALTFAGGDLDHVVRRRFLLAGGADLHIARLGPQLREVRRAEVAHAGLHSTDEVGQHFVNGTGNFLERVDALGGDLAGEVVLVVTIARGTAGLHGGERSHAAVLFVDLAADFHDL